jgi:hypothetical protein
MRRRKKKDKRRKEGRKETKKTRGRHDVRMVDADEASSLTVCVE